MGAYFFVSGALRLKQHFYIQLLKQALWYLWGLAAGSIKSKIVLKLG